MAAFNLVDVIEAQNILGEGALWHTETQSLWWTDIPGQTLFRYDTAYAALRKIPVPDRICSFGFTDDPACLIVAFDRGLARLNTQSGAVTWVFRPEFSAPDMRFNDGHTDRQGRFWTGTMVEGPFPPPRHGRLYCLSPDGSVAAHDEAIGITNAICTSPDGTHLYFADSARQQIFVCDLDPVTGKIGHQRPFAHTTGIVQPDGAVTDTTGHLWNAEWDGGRITRYAPDGTITDQLELPVSRPTSLAFGGEKHNLLFVTSARDGLSQAALRRQPMAGNVLVFETDITGISDAAFI